MRKNICLSYIIMFVIVIHVPKTNTNELFATLCVRFPLPASSFTRTRVHSLYWDCPFFKHKTRSENCDNHPVTVLSLACCTFGFVACFPACAAVVAVVVVVVGGVVVALFFAAALMYSHLFSSLSPFLGPYRFPTVRRDWYQLVSLCSPCRPLLH